MNKYEIKVNKAWHAVDEGIFRSWGGERRLNGDTYKGPVYYLGSEKVYAKLR